MGYNALLKRQIKTEFATLGTLEIMDANNKSVFRCKTLELPYRSNKKVISCIPLGIYRVINKFSLKFGECFQVLNVKDRSGILFHIGNNQTNTHGCILVGAFFSFNSNVENWQIYESTKTMQVLRDLNIREFELLIVDLC